MKTFFAILDRLKPYRKAIAGGLVFGLGALRVAIGDDNGLTSLELLDVIYATLAGAGVVAAVPNAPKAKGKAK